ncbi:MAG: hypothetical protein HY905_20890 [Deltaproteobacteria bacterium]|nr:hypothetical protein [Deltaproteobacteria bacterium]
MPRRVDARDVLDPNAHARRAFRARVVGHFARTGPNAWDDYEFVAEPGKDLDVLPGIPIQVEEHGPSFRTRSRGRVVRAEWIPSGGAADSDRPGLAALRARFLAECVEGFAEAAGQGAGAVIVRKLRG